MWLPKPSNSRCPNQSSLERTLTVLHPHPWDTTISTCSTHIQLPISSPSTWKGLSAYAGWRDLKLPDNRAPWALIKASSPFEWNNFEMSAFSCPRVCLRDSAPVALGGNRHPHYWLPPLFPFPILLSVFPSPSHSGSASGGP